MARKHTYSELAHRDIRGKTFWLDVSRQESANLQRSTLAKIQEIGSTFPDVAGTMGISVEELEQELKAARPSYEIIYQLELLLEVPEGSLFLGEAPKKSPLKRKPSSNKSPVKNQGERILDFVSRNPGSRWNDISDGLGLSNPGSIWHRIKTLLSDQKIENRAGKFFLCSKKVSSTEFISRFLFFFGSLHNIQLWIDLSKDENFLTETSSALNISMDVLRNHKTVSKELEAEIIRHAVKIGPMFAVAR